MTLYQAAEEVALRIAEALQRAGIVDVSDQSGAGPMVLSAVNCLAIAIVSQGRGMVEIGD